MREFQGIDQIFFERANHALSVGVPFRVAVTRENLADSERFTVILVRFRSRLATVIADQERTFALGNFRDSLWATSKKPHTAGFSNNLILPFAQSRVNGGNRLSYKKSGNF